ncbi:PQQ-dependent dehydrogenase, methanol/ethanol family [Halioxenophilus aromaticivorans]|uniref:Cytochrome c domain-containing protein n=1 Tax=Halioxenophilus aromaticivorans TaxID=1306992 RepID=A0AAV3TXW3_9ALTE
MCSIGSVKKAYHFVLSVVFIMVLSGCDEAEKGAYQGSSQVVPQHSAANTYNWPGIGLDSDETRFVRLNQITPDNIDQLGLVSSFDLSAYPHVVSAPVAANGIIYFSAGLSVIHAVEAASGKLLWKYDPEVANNNPDKIRIGWGSRGITYANGKILWGTTDGRLLAINAETGALLWSQMTVEPDDARSITGPPRVFDGKVIIGHGGADYGPVRGYVTAYDENTGEQLWRFYTVPGNPADGFENSAMEMAAKTWAGEWWKYGGGGTVWNAMTYDKELDRIYLGTGNGSPWNQKIRSPGGGDNLFLCSIVAVDASTGEYIWHYQINPGETWDYNAATEMILADLKLAGKDRKVLMQVPKNGFFYVLDRVTGELISADPVAKVTWAEKIDLETGRPVENPGMRFETEDTFMWPGGFGAHTWLPMSFSPKTGLVYVPIIELPGFYTQKGINLKTWKATEKIQMNTGVGSAFEMEPSDKVGSSHLLAWDPVKKQAAWDVPTPAIVNGATFVTETDLVFQNQVDGRFVARNALTGDEVWSVDLGGPSVAPAISFMADGKQYIAVTVGLGGPPANANAGFIRMPSREQPKRLMVFALGGQLEMPHTGSTQSPEPLAASNFVVDDKKALAGRDIFNAVCFLCHGPAAVSGGGAPDLRASGVPLSFEAMVSITRDGVLKERGMPQFYELSDEDIVSLQHYIRMRANEALTKDGGVEASEEK